MSRRTFFNRHRRTGNLYKLNAKRLNRLSNFDESSDDVDTIDDGAGFSAWNAPSANLQSSGEEANSEDPEEATARHGKYGDMSLKECLRYCALVKGIPHETMNLILDVLREKTPYNLPKDARTLLKTSRTAASNIINVEGGLYWYKGVKQCLLNRFRNTTLPAELSLNVSIDGLPLHNSSPATFWPILISVHEMPLAPPMTVAIFHGITKPPSIEEFLRPFVTELNELEEFGLTINNMQHEIKVRAVIADAPARAFLKGVANFNAKHGCLKCTCVGEHNSSSRTVVFTDCDAPLRTDSLFRQFAYGIHHKEPSPFLDLLYIDMIEDIIISDRLHLLDLGIMRKLLKGWVLGRLGQPKWSTATCIAFSKALKAIKLPNEIHRSFRNIQDINYWKASEYSSFLHYASVGVLKDYIADDQYKHFMLFFCAITIFSSNAYRSYWEYGGQLLKSFVTQFPQIYGTRYMTSNVHNLLHVVEEIKKFGPLNTLSAYPFENELQHLKRLLRNGWKSLHQIVNRLSELEDFQSRMNQDAVPSQVNLTKHGSEVIIECNGFKLKKKFQDSWFLTVENQVVQYSRALYTSSTSVVIIGKRFNDHSHYFEEPCNSTGLNICHVNINSKNISKNVECHPEHIKCKLVLNRLDVEGNAVLIPLLHTLM
ncbi:uncharacterized protein LOC118512515 [Anopheles stephensi]|uniref:uncharacterized protein LOC118512515 n=2 Tax=Anopheles stephensi TaxID=30069 RepID=UPI0016589662|nr:uncharacterized protein LOC118512502 isoform X1 [Anopheles stephensi]XP_035912931.1 uncharacterized protein LOC118512515 [Anopheles stephensi]